MSETKRSPEEVLNALLSVEDVPERDVPMKRFGVDFRIRALQGDVIDKVQDQATFYEGKGDKRKKKVDEQKFSALIIQRACIVPDFSDPALLNKYETHDAVDVIKKRLLAGELANLTVEIMDLSGFGEDTSHEEVKN